MRSILVVYYKPYNGGVKMESTLKEKSKTESQPKETAIDFLKRTFPTDGTSLDIRPLWGDYYRLNFWKKNGEGEGSIVKSYFVRVKDTPKGWKVENHDLQEGVSRLKKMKQRLGVS